MKLLSSSPFALVLNASLLLLLAGHPAGAVVLKEWARVVATVDGTPIFQRQVDLALRRELDATRLAQLPPEQRQSALDQSEKAVLNELVGRVLLVNAARREGLTISKDDLRERMEAIAKRLSGGEAVEDFLKQNGLDQEEFLRDVEESLLIERLIDAKTRDLPPATGEEVARYYRENPAEFRQEENVRIRIISLDIRGLTNPIHIDEKRRRLEEIRQRLLDNPLLDFAKVATEESESFSAQQGGAVGPFGRGQRAVEPAVEEAAFTQKPGAIGQIIETRSGFHLLKVEEKKPPRTLLFEEVRGPISTYLAQMKRREVMVRLIDEWRAVARIERVVHEPGQPEPPAGQPAPPAKEPGTLPE